MRIIISMNAEGIYIIISGGSFTSDLGVFSLIDLTPDPPCQV